MSVSVATHMAEFRGEPFIIVDLYEQAIGGRKLKQVIRKMWLRVKTARNCR